MGLKNSCKRGFISRLKNSSTAILIATLLLSALLLPNFAGGKIALAKPDDDTKVVAGELIVRLQPGSNMQSVLKNVTASTHNAYQATSDPTKDAIQTLNLYRVHFLNTADGNSLAALFQAQPEVLYAELNYTSQDPTGNPWVADGGFQTQYQQQYASSSIEADAAHNLSQGAGVKVAVIDTGVNFEHPALKPQIASDKFRYDYVNFNNNPADKTDDSSKGGLDVTGHGSGVAGLVLLAAPQATLMPIKVLTSNGQGDIFSVLQGMVFATSKGAQIINLSLGTSADTRSMRDVVSYVWQQGVIMVASCGNANVNVPQYPCAYPNVIGVAALDANNQKASFSNYGSFVSLSAPGVGLYTTYWNKNKFATWSGTSEAAPLVAGGAALIEAMYPNLTPTEVIARLKAAATPIDQLNPGYTGQLGSGCLDLYHALAN